ncbi:asparagine synthase (glutamine-hydrolyzing) [Actinoplanes sp. NPDC048791]|uniref:asparagine synthase (glutamine-hydrolyzing) n=1 Tax=Actinoplanes sp. NPDC048791 TaxID=3154623 RepID=UPI0033DAB004
MAGIVGWLDFDRDLSNRRDVVRAMAGAVANRGPDGESVWAGGPVALGHRRIAGEDPEGQQPYCVSADGRPVVAITFDGELFNATALRGQLLARGCVLRGGGTAELVAQAYLIFGDRVAEQLDGIFAFALWDARQERLLLVRDRIGIKPLYYQMVGGGVVFGSEPKAIFAHPLTPAAVDEDGLREVIGFAGTPGHAVFRNMHKVPGGSVTTVHRRGVTTRAFWQLEAREHTEDLDGTVDRVHGLLEEAIAKRLTDDPALAIMLSGGLDSSLVTALATRIARERGNGQLRTISVDFATHARNAERADGNADASFAAVVAEHLGTDHTDIELDRDELWDPVTRDAAMRAMPDVPLPVGEMSNSIHMFFEAVGRRADITMMGEWSDTIFGEFLHIDKPEVVAAETLPWVAAGQYFVRNSGIGTGLFDTDLLKRLDIPGYCADQYRTQLAKVPHVAGADPQERRMREICYLYLQGWMEMGLAQDDGLTANNGLRLRVPFVEPELVQYAFNMPWALKTHGGRSKSILRRLGRQVLPDEILDRPKNPFPSTPDVRHAEALRDALQEVLADREAPIAPYLNREAATAQLADLDRLAGGWQGRADIEMMLQTNAWLARYGIRVLL